MAQMARTRLAQLLCPEHVTLWLELALKSIEIEINRINRVIFFPLLTVFPCCNECRAPMPLPSFFSRIFSPNLISG